MFKRKGRLNDVKLLSKSVVQKTAVVQESARTSRLAIEAWALYVAGQRGVNVPRILNYYRNSVGQEVLVAQKIEGGKHLTRKHSQENMRCLTSVGRQMKLLSGVSKRYGWIDPTSFVGSSANWRKFLRCYTLQYGTRLVRDGILESGSLEKTIRFLDEVDLALSQPSLVHRDLKFTNLLRDKNGKVWIVDWENAILGDPLYDLAIFGVRYGHTLPWQNLVKGYTLATNLPRYTLYEMVGLLGIIDFCRRYSLGYVAKLRRFLSLIQYLK